MDPNQQPQDQSAAPVAPPQPVSAPPMPQQPYAAPQENPGQLFGILSIVMFFVFPIAGLVLGVLSRNKSKAAGMPSTLGTVGLVMNIIAVVLGVLYVIFVVVLIAAGAASGASSSSL